MKYNYVLKRSNRRTLSMTLSCDNQLVVHSPMHMPLSKIESFIVDKSDWLEKHMAKNDRVNCVNEQVIAKKCALVGGVALPLFIGDSNLITQNFVRVKDFKDLKSTYIKYLKSDFIKLFNQICGNTNLTASSVNVRDYKSRWGCCDIKNNICFNYKLMMLPENLQEYVIVHELCHTVFHDHSKNFWGLVAAYLPDYKFCIKQLKNFSFLNNIF